MKGYSQILLFSCLIFFSKDILSDPIKVTNFRSAMQPDKLRIVFEVDKPITYTTRSSADKIIVEVNQGKLTAALNKKVLAKTMVNSISSIQTKDGLRLILSLKNPVKLKHFLLAKPNRLVLDLYPVEKKTGSAVNPSRVKPQEPPMSSVNLLAELEQNLINQMDQIDSKEQDPRDITIVIDPGHGGRDPGAVGSHGTLEKVVTLAVARMLQNILNQSRGFRAVLTRNSDTFIPLRQRLAIAHNHKADMFISIHADAYRYKDAQGASVFALSQRGATSESARWLAEKENESELGQAIADKSELLRSVLIDLAQTATISASLEIGKLALEELSRITSLHTKRVEQAGFMVLKSPDIPSLLVEVGFISYYKEEEQLRDFRYQRALAAKLATGIKSYFMRRPPQGTYWSSIKRRVNHNDNRSSTLEDSLPGSDSSNF